MKSIMTGKVQCFVASAEERQSLNDMGREGEERVIKHHRASVLLNWDPKCEQDLATTSEWESAPGRGRSVLMTAG